MYPYKFQQIVRPLVWGVEKWMLSAFEQKLSVVSNGADAGKTITDLCREYREQLLGQAVWERTGERFPLLIKDIIARDKPSIQVHPDDALARKRGFPCGKTEMWYVYDAEPGARLISGFSRNVSPEQYKTLVAEGRITDVLASHSVAPGDAFFIPAGRIHAIGGGISLYEIQQTSDTTYRIFDYNRPGLDGKPRELHTEQALDAIDYNVYDDYKGTLPVSCPYFTTEMLEADSRKQLDLNNLDSFLILIGLSGSATLETAIPHGGPTKGHRTELGEGELVLIPAAATGVTVIPEGGSARIITVNIQQQ